MHRRGQKSKQQTTTAMSKRRVKLSSCLLSFRLHSSVKCYQLGHLSKGKFETNRTDSCPKGSPKGGVWFTVRVEVTSDKSVKIYLNNDLVTSLTAHFPTKGRGGVMVINGFDNVIQFRKFSIIHTVNEPSP